MTRPHLFVEFAAVFFRAEERLMETVGFGQSTQADPNDSVKSKSCWSGITPVQGVRLNANSDRLRTDNKATYFILNFGEVMKSFLVCMVTVLFAASLIAPKATAAPASAALKGKIEARWANYQPLGMWEGGRVKAGGTSSVTVTIDPKQLTYINGACEGCYMFGMTATDETGKVLTSVFRIEDHPQIFIVPGTSSSDKIKVTIDMTSGCEKPQCEYAVGVYVAGPRK